MWSWIKPRTGAPRRPSAHYSVYRCEQYTSNKSAHSFGLCWILLNCLTLPWRYPGVWGRDYWMFCLDACCPLSSAGHFSAIGCLWVSVEKLQGQANGGQILLLLLHWLASHITCTVTKGIKSLSVLVRQADLNVLSPSITITSPIFLFAVASRCNDVFVQIL